MGKVGNAVDEEAAARMAREAAEQARRVAVIDKIHKLEREKATCESCISGLSGAQGSLGEKGSEVKAAFSALNQNDLTRVITIPNVFEGVGALGIKGRMEESAEKIKTGTEVISEVLDAVGAQIGKLQQYINELEKEISSLRATL